MPWLQHVRYEWNSTLFRWKDDVSALIRNSCLFSLINNLYIPEEKWNVFTKFMSSIIENRLQIPSSYLNTHKITDKTYNKLIKKKFKVWSLFKKQKTKDFT